jgi:hypothetical protein
VTSWARRQALGSGWAGALPASADVLISVDKNTQQALGTQSKLRAE